MANQKISFFLENLSGGGEEKIMVHMANAIAEIGHQVDLILTNAEGPLKNQISASVNLIDFNLSNHYLSFPKLVSYLRTNRPDSFISTLELSNLICKWQKYGGRFKRKLSPPENQFPQ